VLDARCLERNKTRAAGNFRRRRLDEVLFVESRPRVPLHFELFTVCRFYQCVRAFMLVTVACSPFVKLL